MDCSGRFWRHCYRLGCQNPDATPAGASCRTAIMIWFVIIATGLINFATRFSMFSGFSPKRLPDWLEDALGFVPIAVLTAIIVPAVLLNDNDTIAIVDNTRFYAALVAIIVALVTRSVLATISTGLMALWTLTYFGF